MAVHYAIQELVIDYIFIVITEGFNRMVEGGLLSWFLFLQESLLIGYFS